MIRRWYHRELSISQDSLNVAYIPFVPQREKHGQDNLMHGIWTHAHGCHSNIGRRILSASYSQASRSRLIQLIPTLSYQKVCTLWYPKKGNQLSLQSRNIRDIQQIDAENWETSVRFLSRICSIFKYVLNLPKISSTGAHILWNISDLESKYMILELTRNLLWLEKRMGLIVYSWSRYITFEVQVCHESNCEGIY